MMTIGSTILTEPARPDRIVGLRLRSLREERGKTQREVGEKLGLTEAGYRYYESGRTQIRVTDLPSLAEAMGVSVGYLTERLGITPPDQDDPTADDVLARVERSSELQPEIKAAIRDLVELSRRITPGEDRT